MIVRTEAVVLRRMDYGETSQIVTLFTREKGRLAVMAKGARLPKSRFGSSLQPMSYMQAVLYYKASRGLQTLTESAHVQHFARIGHSLEKLSVGQRVMELTYALLHEEEANPLVFNLLVETLYQLNRRRGAGDQLASLAFNSGWPRRWASPRPSTAPPSRRFPTTADVWRLERGAVLSAPGRRPPGWPARLPHRAARLRRPRPRRP